MKAKDVVAITLVTEAAVFFGTAWQAMAKTAEPSPVIATTPLADSGAPLVPDERLLNPGRQQLGSSFFPPMPFASTGFPFPLPARKMISEIFQGLDLSESQMESIYKEQCRFRDIAEPLVLKVRSNACALFDALMQQNTDQSQVKQKQAEVDALRQQLTGLLTDHIEKTLEMLTPEQRKKMRQNFLRFQLQPFAGKESS